MTPGAAGADILQCLRCGSERIVAGNVQGYFTPYERKAFAPAWFRNETPDIRIGGDVMEEGHACICLDCGLFWSSVNLDEANYAIQAWGTKELQDRIAPETSSGR